MKVFTSILVFSQENGVSYILLDNGKKTPTWQLKDEDRQSFDIVKAGLYNITGFDPVWFPSIEQSYTYEFFYPTGKEIFIYYSVYFPGLFDLNNISYHWVKISDCKEDDNIYNIIRLSLMKRQ